MTPSYAPKKLYRIRLVPLPDNAFKWRMELQSGVQICESIVYRSKNQCRNAAMNLMLQIKEGRYAIDEN